jgi:hypothetical protein
MSFSLESSAPPLEIEPIPKDIAKRDKLIYEKDGIKYVRLLNMEIDFFKCNKTSRIMLNMKNGKLAFIEEMKYYDKTLMNPLFESNTIKIDELFIPLFSTQFSDGLVYTLSKDDGFVLYEDGKHEVPEGKQTFAIPDKPTLKNRIVLPKRFRCFYFDEINNTVIYADVTDPKNPFKSVKQAVWMKHNIPNVYNRWRNEGY